MPTKKYIKHRHLAAQRQDNRCFYCDLQMWESSPDLLITEHQLSRKQAALLKCTAEHLHARCDGGSDASENIVAACRYCNSNRHKSRVALEPDQYRSHVQKRMRSGRWLAALLPRLLIAAPA